MRVHPALTKVSRVMACGHRPLALRPCSFPCQCTRTKASPPKPFIMGSVTFTIAATAMAASPALPPPFSTCRPTWAASGWLDATMPWGACVAARRESKGSILMSACRHGNAGLFGQKHVPARKLLEHRRIHGKVGCQDIGRVPGDPLGQIDGLIATAVEHDEDACLLAADVLDGVTEA